MALTSRTMRGLTAADVFLALRDGISYDRWVVGTRKIRDVDDRWPMPGSALHYTVGYAPLRKDDKTLVREFEPNRLIHLEAFAWPAGTALIVITAADSPDGCVVSIEEKPQRGPARTFHNPVFDLLIRLRNVETLRRLEQRVRELAQTT
jgi:hypothetical protein